MKTEAQKWGNSLAIRIPKTYAREIGLAAGSEVDLEIKADRLIVVPTRRQRYKLRSRLAGVKKSHRHSEAEWGTAVGQEVW
jgi:antitoxin MazE